MIGFGILLAHLIGDYLLQNDWIAMQKTKRWTVAMLHGGIHAVVYAALVWLIIADQLSIWGIVRALIAVLIIGITHAVIDRLRLAKHFIWVVNQIAPRRNGWTYSWAWAREHSGYGPGKPDWMAFWLMVIIDNTIHLLIAAAAIYWLVLRG